MPRRGYKKPRAFVETDDPLGLYALSRAHLHDLAVRSYSETTIKGREKNLFFFVTWCHERALLRPEHVGKGVLEAFQRWLFHHRKTNGAALSARTQYAHLFGVKSFFRWLVKKGYLEANPAADLDMPRLPQRLPRNVLTIEEAERVLSLPNLEEPYGIRDRAMLETLYSTGIRRTELVRLLLYDIIFDRGVLLVREGKGKKDRMVPIGERALFFVERYVREVRPQLVVPPDQGFLFLTYAGVPFHVDTFGHEVKRYLLSAGLEKPGACHVFRHTMATLMLEGGADVRYVQEMLGHAQLSTTAIYTQVAIDKLKKVHSATHPGARLPAPKKPS